MIPRRLWRQLAVVTVTIVALVPTTATFADVRNSAARMQEAKNALEQARAVRADTATQLDSAARVYEEANAAALRLGAESTDDAGDLEAADHAVQSAQDQARDQALALYKRPVTGGGTGLVAQAMVGALDAGSALHHAALADQIAAGANDRVDQARHAQALTVDGVYSERVVVAGTAASLRELRKTSAALRKQLALAEAGVGSASAELRDASEAAAAAAEAAEDARRAAAAAPSSDEIAITGAAPSGPAPATVGRSCPIGTPNGFIDSWGFPRSGGRTHKGVDMFASYGTPLFAAGTGRVEVSSNSLGGLTVNVYEDNGDYYYYAHLASITVADGDRVGAGQMVGTTGTSGNAAGTPPHLHWEFHPAGGEAVNPYPLAYALCR